MEDDISTSSNCCTPKGRQGLQPVLTDNKKKNPKKISEKIVQQAVSVAYELKCMIRSNWKTCAIKKL